MRIVGPIQALAAGALLAALLSAALGLWPATAAAQPFFGLDETLQGGSGLEAVYGHSSDHSSDPNNPANDTAADRLTRQGSARLRYKVFIAGTLGAATREHQISNGIDQTEETRRGASYLALEFEGIFTQKSDGLTLEVNTSRRHERFAYNGYLRLLDAVVRSEQGLAYRLGPLVLGYARGHEREELRIDDPSGPPFTQEVFEFQYRSRLVGLFFGDPEKVGLGLVAARKDTPAVPGVVISKQPGFEELKRVGLQLYRLSISVEQTHVQSSFTGDASSDTIERTGTLGLQITRNLNVGISQVLTTSEQGLILLSTPTTSRRRHTADQFQIKFAF